MLTTAIVLAGGKGTRMGTVLNGVAKPLVPIGTHPMLEHLISQLRFQGIHRFLLAAGFRSESIRDWVAGVGSKYGQMEIVDDGAEASTHTRILSCLAKLADEDGDVLITYGDGIADIDLGRLATTHREAGLPVTMSIAGLPSQYGVAKVDSAGRVTEFREKPILDDVTINIGFTVLGAGEALDWESYTDFESEMLPALAGMGKLNSYRHIGYWQSVDSPADLLKATHDAASGIGPWID